MTKRDAAELLRFMSNKKSRKYRDLFSILYGLHSGIPLCCVFYAYVIKGPDTKLQHPDFRVNYSACPNCIKTGYKQRLAICGKKKRKGYTKEMDKLNYFRDCDWGTDCPFFKEYAEKT